MKVRKGGVVLTIPPTDLAKYRQSGWKKVDERKPELTKATNERKKSKMLAKGGM